MYMSFSNDLVDVLSFAKFKIYADDLTIYANIKCANNRLTFNTTWTNVVNGALSGTKLLILISTNQHFSYNKMNYAYKLNDFVIKI